MKMIDIPLKAGQPWPIGRGRVVRVLDALHPVTIKTQALNGKSNQETKLIANMGAEFVPFEKADIVSEFDQVVKIAYSELNIFDNRLGVESATVMQVVEPQKNRVLSNHIVDDSARIQVLAANPKRKKSLIKTSANVFFYNSEVGGSGVEIDGEFDDESNGELWAVAPAGQVRVVELIEINYS